MTKKELEEANATLKTRNEALERRVESQMELLNSFVIYLRQIQSQLFTAASSIETVLESHATLTAPIPEKKDDHKP